VPLDDADYEAVNRELENLWTMSPGWWGPEDQSDEQLLSKIASLPRARAKHIPVIHSRLLNEVAWPRFDRVVARRPDLAEAAQVPRRLLKGAGSQLWPGPWGPIERTFRAVETGVISLAQGKQAAATAGRYEHVFDSYAGALAAFFIQTAVSGEQQSAVLAAQLLYAAANQLDIGTYAGSRVEAVRALCDTTLLRLSEVPDGRLFHEAKQAAEQTASATSGRAKGLTLHNLGRLLVLSYSVNRSYPNFWSDWQRSQQRLMLEMGSELRYTPADSYMMPNPLGAVAEGIQVLQQARSLLSGGDAQAVERDLREATTFRNVISA
jgi:hypothetical protein